MHIRFHAKAVFAGGIVVPIIAPAPENAAARPSEVVRMIVFADLNEHKSRIVSTLDQIPDEPR